MVSVNAGQISRIYSMLLKYSFTYQANKATGLLASTCPIVLVRVACSRAYALPVFMNSAALSRPLRSSSLNVLLSTPDGSGMMQKLTEI